MGCSVTLEFWGSGGIMDFHHSSHMQAQVAVLVGQIPFPLVLYIQANPMTIEGIWRTLGVLRRLAPMGMPTCLQFSICNFPSPILQSTRMTGTQVTCLPIAVSVLFPLGSGDCYLQNCHPSFPSSNLTHVTAVFDLTVLLWIIIRELHQVRPLCQRAQGEISSSGKCGGNSTTD